MKTVSQKIVPFVLTSTALHFVVPTISVSHPTIAVLLTFLNVGCSVVIILIVALAFGTFILHKTRRDVLQIWWNTLSYLRTFKYGKNASHNTIVPVEQLERLEKNIQRLRLALYGLTPEVETARRTHFQIRCEALPPLVLPPQNAILYAEFEQLTKCLKHFGFPSLKSVRLQQKDFDFIRTWGSGLDARLQQWQKYVQDQHQATQSALFTAIEMHRSIGTMNAAALSNAGYQRIHGALKILENIAQNGQCPNELIRSCIQSLQHDMDTLLKQLK